MAGQDALSVTDILTLAVGAPATFAFVFLIFRYTTGWNRLERLYLKRGAAIEHDIGWQLYMSFSTPVFPAFFNNFRFVMAIGANRTGIVLRAFWPTRWCFRTLQIPWTEFTVADADLDQGVPYEILLSKIPKVQIHILRETGDRLIELGAVHTTLRVTP